NMNRDGAVEFALTPLAIRNAKLALLNQCICDICGKKGTYDRHQWGYLNYLGHPMKICPDCIKDIYDKSPKPWEHN
ncbi:unnamed protein product, partial [marine sediment metagenome]